MSDAALESPAPAAPSPRPNGSAVVDSVVLAVLVVAMCSQLDLGAIGQDVFKTQGHVVKQLKVALPDVALPLVFFWFVIRTTLLSAWRKLWWPPLACWALVFAMVVAIIHSQPILTAISNGSGGDGLKGAIKHLITKESKEAIAETLQFAAYFMVAPWLFVNLIHDRRTGTLIVRRRLAVTTFAVAIMFTTLLAAIQAISGRNEPAALFGSPNIYGGFLAIALPLLCARFLQEWRQLHYPVLYLALALLLGLSTIISVWAVAALFIGVIVVGWMLTTPTRLAMLLLVMSIATYFIWTIPSPLKPSRDESLTVMSPKPPEDPSQQRDWKKQYIEWYAVFNWANDQLPVAGAEGEHAKSFATGVGPGNYQGNVGRYYGGLPNETKMPPDSNNLFLVQAVSLGFLGLGALIWVLLHFAHQARLAVRRFPEDWLGTGVLGSLAAFVFVNLFHAMIVRGTGIVLAFILSLAIIALQREDLELDTNL